VNLAPIRPPRPLFQFACIRCGMLTRSDAEGASADTDGIPFRVYYCAKCAAVRRAERMRAGYSDQPITGVKP
jgi:hypothetical protein